MNSLNPPSYSSGLLFHEDPRNSIIGSSQFPTESSISRESYIIEEAEELLKYLEEIFTFIDKFVARKDINPDKEYRNLLSSGIWTLDKAMETVIGISRVASSATSALSQAIYYSKREKNEVCKHKSSGYFATSIDKNNYPIGNVYDCNTGDISFFSLEQSQKLKTHELLLSKKLNHVDNVSNEDDLINSARSSYDDTFEPNVCVSNISNMLLSRKAYYELENAKFKQTKNHRVKVFSTRKILSFSIL